MRAINNSIKKTLTFVAKNKRYLVVFCLLILLAIFGKKIPKDEELPFDTAMSPFMSADYVIDSSSQNVISEAVFNSKRGDFFRLSFIAKNGFVKKEEMPVDKLKVFAFSEKGQRQELTTVDLQTDFSGYEINFKAPEDGFRYIIFEKEPKAANSLVYVNNIRVSQLSVTKEADLISLKPSIMGVTKINRVVAKGEDTDNILWDFNHKRQSVGQFFTADSEDISSIAFKLHFRGNGGFGNYELELREASLQDGVYKLSDKTISSFSFSSLLARSYYWDPSNPEWFRFPLAAQLKKGKTYFVGIKNTANFNIMNHLQFYGIKTGDGNALVNDDTGATTKIGLLAYKLYAADFTNLQGIRIPDGASIEDLGSGQAGFYYEDSTFLNKLEKTNSKYEVTYRLNTVYSAQRAQLKLIRKENMTPLGVSYSVDGVEWEKIDMVGNGKTEYGNFTLPEAKSIFIKIKTTGVKDIDRVVGGISLTASIKIN